MASPEPSKYANLAPDERGHCSWFLTRTNAEHRATMEHPFMKSIYDKTFNKEAYIQYLVGQYLTFSQLEFLCLFKRKEAPLNAIFDEDLHRAPSLVRDLEFWAGQGWKSLCDKPSEITKRYLAELEVDANDPWMLLCHHFLQYNASLSGGQFLGKCVAERAIAEFGTSNGAINFYSFPAACQPTHGRVQQYIDAMDKLDISSELRNKMLACMSRVYGLLLAMFDEAHSLAPSSKDSQSSGSGAAKESADKVPPPPLSPGDKMFSIESLRTYANVGGPLYTSLLGRVYDVSKGSEFFGPQGPYGMFAYHDGTYNLAIMTLKKTSLDRFKYELDEEDKQTLADWIAYFDHKYGAPVGQLEEKHCISLSDLPRALKIPFGGGEEAGSDATPASKL